MTLDLTVIVALITAIAAVVAPVITAQINARSAERLKRLDFIGAHAYETVAELAKAYSELKENNYLSANWAFMAASYKVMAQISEPSIQQGLTNLLHTIRDSGGKTTPQTDTEFDSIITDISNYLPTMR